MRNTEQKYRECAETKMSQSQAARHLGVSRQAVEQAGKRFGLEFRPDGGPKRKAINLELVSVAAKHGISVGKVADLTGLCRDSVRRLARQAGVEVKRKPHPTPTGDKVAELAAKGMTVTEVARHLGITIPCVSRAKKVYGIQFHRDGRSS